MSELRIIAGEWRGRRIGVPPGSVRPTADRVREALMSIIHARLVGARVLDLCAGSGALGLEALSRGAVHCDFVERDPGVCAALRANIAALDADDRVTVHTAEAMAFVRATTERWDVAFADPPYADPTGRALATLWIAAPFASVFALEHEGITEMPADPGVVDVRRYGRTAVSIYTLAPQT